MRKFLLGLAILGGIVILALIGRFAGGSSGAKVNITKVTSRTIRSSILASGNLTYREQVELRPEVIGKIVALPVDEGDRVKKGQTVLRLDPESYQAQVAQQQAHVNQQQIAIKRQHLTVKNLQRQWGRKQKLYKKGLLDADSFDTATNQLNIAKEDLKGDREALKLAKAQLAEAREKLAKTVIRSPINGVITSLGVKVGETVISGTTNIAGSVLMEISDPSETLAEVQVDEADIADVHVGEKAAVDAVAFPNTTIPGRVNFIASSATTSSGQQGRSFKVKILLHDANSVDIRPGMSARASIYTQSTPNALAVPIQAVLYQNSAKATSTKGSGNTYVFVARNGKAHKVPVKTGVSSDLYQAIVKGLQNGERIITGPYLTLHHLTNGAAITSLSQ